MIYMPGQDRQPHKACRQCTSPHHWHTCIAQVQCAHNQVLGLFQHSNIPSQCVLSTEPGGQGPLLKGVVYGSRLLEDVPEGHRHPPTQLGDEQAVCSIVGHFTPCWLTLQNCRIFHISILLVCKKLKGGAKIENSNHEHFKT